MARETFTKESFWAELDELGEDVVRERIAAGIYSSANRKLELAELWLSERERKRREAIESESLEAAKAAASAAKRASDAAERQATTAERALYTAIAAIIIAIISIAIQVIGLGSN